MENLFFTLSSHTAAYFNTTLKAERAAEILVRELRERGLTGINQITSPSDAQLTFLFISSREELPQELRYSVKVMPEGEGYFIRTCFSGKKTVLIAAQEKAAFLFAVGAVLRQIRFYGDLHAEIPDFCIYDCPRHSFRTSLMFPHMQDNGYKWWSKEQHVRYLEDLTLWGANVAMYASMHFGQMTERCFEDGTAEALNWEKFRTMPDTAASLGLGYGLYFGANDVFPEDFESVRHAKTGAAESMFIAAEQCTACPSDPETFKKIVARREELFSKLSRVDYLYISSSDYGGCACDDCNPYILKYLELSKAIAAALRKHHPAAKVYVGTQLMCRQGILDYFIPYITGAESGWINGIVYAVHGIAVTLPELARAVEERNYELLLYPEITMADNWGRIGATPWVKRFAFSLERSYDIADMSNRKGDWINTGANMFNEDYPKGFDYTDMYDLISGTFSYSEGLQDDIAKVIWLSYNMNPTRSPEQALEDYCRFYFGADAAEKLAEAVLLMEETSYRRSRIVFEPPLTCGDDGSGLNRSRRVFELVKDAGEIMPEWSKNSWRFLMLELRARIDLAAFMMADGGVTAEDRNEIKRIAAKIYELSGDITLISCYNNPWDPEKLDAALEELLTRRLTDADEDNAPVPDVK